MKLKNHLLFATGCGLFFLASCQSPKEKLTRKWQFDSFEVPSMDSMMEVRRKSIDTISQVDSNMAMFLGTNNLDSVKKLLKAQLDDYKKQQQEAAKQSYANFRKDGIAIFGAGIQEDSAKWALVGDKKIVLTPMHPQSAEVKPDTIDIESISAGKLRLKTSQGSNYMFINLRPFTKEDSLAAAELNRKQMEEMQQQMQQMQQMQQQQAEANAAKQAPDNTKK